jgi:hypothetical protein
MTERPRVCKTSWLNSGITSKTPRKGPSANPASEWSSWQNSPGGEFEDWRRERIGTGVETSLQSNHDHVRNDKVRSALMMKLERGGVKTGNTQPGDVVLGTRRGLPCCLCRTWTGVPWIPPRRPVGFGRGGML